MIDYIHINPRLLKMLDELKELESATAFAAKKADAIIQALLNGKRLARAGKLTRHGDARIKKCLKYDLGQGFRLVCVKDGRDLYVLYSGSHDSCDTWMDKNRNLKLSKVRETMDRLKVKKTVHGAPDPMPCPGPEEYDDIPLGTISQRDLRAVFQGLVNP